MLQSRLIEESIIHTGGFMNYIHTLARHGTYWVMDVCIFGTFGFLNQASCVRVWVLGVVDNCRTHTFRSHHSLLVGTRSLHLLCVCVGSGYRSPGPPTIAEPTHSLTTRLRFLFTVYTQTKQHRIYTTLRLSRSYVWWCLCGFWVSFTRPTDNCRTHTLAHDTFAFSVHSIYTNKAT